MTMLSAISYRRLFILAALFLSGSTAFASGKGDSVVIGTRHEITSKVLGEKRVYLVHAPGAYQFKQEAYPVLVVLDAEDNFAHTSAAVDVLARNGRIPELIVVGINNTDRNRDQTTAPREPADFETGGADKFLSFIADELLPQIDHEYPTRPYRILIGHSFGGLFAVNALLTRPQVFNAYLAISPSLWWDKQALVDSSPDFFKSHHDLRADFYMTMGEEGGPMLGGAWKFAASMEEASAPEFRWHFKRSPEESHGTIPYKSTYEGLQTLFDGYFIADALGLYRAGGVQAIQRHFAEVSKRLGYPLPPPTGALMSAAGALAEQQNFDESEALMRQATELDPRDPNPLIGLAHLAKERKDNVRVLAYLKQALAIAPGNPEARRLLEEYPEAVSQIPKDLDLSKKELESYIGTYKTHDDPQKLRLENSRLFIEDAFGRCDLQALTRDHFYCEHSDTQVIFHRKPNGRIGSLTMQYPKFSYERVKTSE